MTRREHKALPKSHFTPQADGRGVYAAQAGSAYEQAVDDTNDDTKQYSVAGVRAACFRKRPSSGEMVVKARLPVRRNQNRGRRTQAFQG